MPEISETAEIIEPVAAYIDRHQLLPVRGSVVVAVSGGADSMCLLHLLHLLCGAGKRYPDIQLYAAHLNHQLRGEQSAHDAAAVAAVVARWEYTLIVGEADVPTLARAEHRSIEEAARVARYRFLRDVARATEQQGQVAEQSGQVCALIAVAHHADDQVETLLLHWLRGSGLPGMMGMKPRQQDIIRPLLAITHVQTVEYCRRHGIPTVEDASNADPAYTRNRVRYQLLPLLESINPGFRAALLRNADVLAADLDFIEAQVEAHWSQVAVPVAAGEQVSAQQSITLRIPALLALPLSIQRHLVRRAAEQLCGGQSPLELRHYILIEHLLRIPADRQERTLHLPHGLRLSRIQDAAILECIPVVGTRSNVSLTDEDMANAGEAGLPGEDAINRVPTTSERSREVRLSVPGEAIVPGSAWMARAELLPGDIMEKVRAALRCEDWTRVWQLLPTSRSVVYIDRASAGEELLVRTRRAGDRMQPLGMAHDKKVQDILVDAHIPRSERDTHPIFYAASPSQEEVCLWLAGVCLDQRARLTGQTEGIVKLSVSDTNWDKQGGRP